ncbi:CASP8 and FADD-like apoptosis regulator [Eublepharis macularius]|uniref:CASP8 and FADD-like apoptosis regulator n=1 Tax=Eublepharis macularius TaxID=481883 RepID=A0AA97IYW3_EUBMA|nr:CASP8 and FADD-like apoptosis regulator [Eublepharis macularius]
MTVCKVPAAILYQIEQELDKDEKDTMLFLCQDLVPDLPPPDARKLLVALNEREMLTACGLAELLYRMKRFDLLKKVLGTGRAAVETSLARNPQMLSPYRVLMTEISEDLDKEDLESFVFLLLDHSGMSYLKKAKEKSFLGIITDLEKLDLVSPNQLDLIENCLLNIHRKDLAKKIQKYRVEAPVHTIGSAPVYISVLQASLPELSLADPPGIVNKGKLLNGSGAIQKEQIPVSVPETGTALPQVPEQYRMQSRPLGICLIIDCIGNDTGMLVEAFNALHFEVHCYPFLNMNSLPHKLCEVARLKQHKVYDCFACVLVSRGSHQDIFCTDRLLPGYPLEKVKRFFTGDKCAALLGKPKLFFIQNYVEPGHHQEHSSLVEADGDLVSAIPQVADILWSQCMVDASALERSPGSSSYYLSTLTELLLDPRKRKLPLLDILLELNDRVYGRNREQPAEHHSLLLKHTLRKKLFLSRSEKLIK